MVQAVFGGGGVKAPRAWTSRAHAPTCAALGHATCQVLGGAPADAPGSRVTRKSTCARRAPPDDPQAAISGTSAPAASTATHVRRRRARIDRIGIACYRTSVRKLTGTPPPEP